MTSLCPRCLLRTRVPRLIQDRIQAYTATCRVCGKRWYPYDPKVEPLAVGEEPVHG